MEAAIENLISDLPDKDAAGRFIRQLTEEHPSHTARLMKNEGLLSDVLTLVSFSPLLAATLLQNPDYLWWLSRKRSGPVGLPVGTGPGLGHWSRSAPSRALGGLA